jgi:ABC-type oligopeptide transport system ATPase subunit
MSQARDVTTDANTSNQPHTLLEVKDLVKHFPVRSTGVIQRTIGQVQAVDGINFTVNRGESLGLVGESGCGKSTTGRLLTKLYEPTSGQMIFEGTDLAPLNRKQMLPFRKDIQMIFQDPYSSLNPRHTVGAIVGSPLRVHDVVPKDKMLNRVQELLALVGLNPEHYNRYPNEFSGGQRQRIGIARALALQPKIMIADEPVSALDVSIQAQVVNLLLDLQKEFDISFLFIAHDLAVVRHFCTRVAVMYLARWSRSATATTSTTTRTTPTRRRCCRPSLTSGRRSSAVGCTGSSSSATYPAPSTRPRAAASVHAAGRRRTSARSRSRR